jgi:uncharacterized protein
MKLGYCAVSIGAAVIAVSSLYCLAADKPAGGKKKILFYSQSFGFRHSVVARPLSGEQAFAEKMLKEICEPAGYEISVTQDFNDLRNLNRYDAIVLYTTGNPLIDRGAFLEWIRKGGAVIGIHTATDTFHSKTNGQVPMEEGKMAPLQIPDWPEYVKVIGAPFITHGPKHDPIVIKVLDPNSPATRMLGSEWTIGDEIYLFDPNRINPNIHILLTTDTKKTNDASLEGHKMTKGGNYPIAWTNTEGEGRVFYTSLGHDEAVWKDPKYQQHLLGGVAWALDVTDKK